MIKITGRVRHNRAYLAIGNTYTLGPIDEAQLVRKNVAIYVTPDIEVKAAEQSADTPPTPPTAKPTLPKVDAKQQLAAAKAKAAVKKAPGKKTVAKETATPPAAAPAAIDPNLLPKE